MTIGEIRGETGEFDGFHTVAALSGRSKNNEKTRK